ncbi:MAG: hypothetical protein HPY73_06420 [Methanomassiliicoccales archaeon]|nr:MAG: hypothetical protein HPY73_06420 [Methanomassiliicoccales archaeon]
MDKSPYSILGAVKYAFVLTFALWWLPIVGPMIAGYITGRKAGKAWVGVFAALIALLSVTIVSMVLNSGVAGEEGTADGMKEWLVTIAPIFGPYFDFADQYMHYYIGAIQISTGVHLDIYILTIAFAYIGGAIATQTWSEMGYVSRHGGNNMTVAFHNMGGRPRKAPRLTVTKDRGKTLRSSNMSFESLRPVAEDDEVTDPVERGIERAQLERSDIRTRSHRNVNASRNSRSRGTFRARSGPGRQDKGDWRWL